MKQYKTTHEIASIWGVTSKTVQNLCKSGKIEGAIKRGGIWFMPDDTPNSLRNTKSSAEPLDFVGTKRKIFDSSIELFMLHGFENVSMKDIADAIGLRQSAIYNHFPSKDKILDTIYNFYRHHFLEERPNIDDLDPILREGTVVEIITCVRYVFKDAYTDEKMLNITKIIYQRQGIDERARELVKSLIMDDGIQYAEAVYKRAIEIGRLAPFDVAALSMLINALRFYILSSAIADPSLENLQGKSEIEDKLYNLAAKHLKDLGPLSKDA